MTVLTRAFATDLQVRGDDGRTLYGTVVPYGVPTQIGRYTETFVRGAFADAADVLLTATHPKDGDQLPIGVSVELRNEADALHGAFHISDVDLGNQVLALVKDKVPLGLSVGFIEGTNRWNTGRTVVQRVSATLDHVAVVRTPAYQDARIVGVRGAQPLSAPLLLLATRHRP
jgi:HK97 family phage prohead protease